jgi:hypothetical protein
MELKMKACAASPQRLRKICAKGGAGSKIVFSLKGDGMRIAILLWAALAGAPLWAMQLNLTCFAKTYVCTTGPNGYSCSWQTVTPSYQATLDLVRDPNYPSADFPYEVYRARYQTTYDNHQLTLDVFYSDHDMTHPMKVYANLNARTVMAETTGSDQIDIALRNQNYGRGFICTNFLLIQ